MNIRVHLFLEQQVEYIGLGLQLNLSDIWVSISSTKTVIQAFGFASTQKWVVSGNFSPLNLTKPSLFFTLQLHGSLRPHPWVQSIMSQFWGDFGLNPLKHSYWHLVSQFPFAQGLHISVISWHHTKGSPTLSFFNPYKVYPRVCSFVTSLEIIDLFKGL